MDISDESFEPSVRFEKHEIPLREPVHGMRVLPATLGVPEWWPSGARVGVMLAQGARDDEPLLSALQRELTERRYLTLRFPLPYMVAKRSRQDDERTMERVYRDVMSYLEAGGPAKGPERIQFKGGPTVAPARIFVGGKNQGALAAAELVNARLRIEGIFFLGYPLHKQDTPENLRASKLYRAVNPLFFVQGERDRHCDLAKLRGVLSRVGAPVHLHVVKNVGHPLHPPRRGGRTDEDVAREILHQLEQWMLRTLGDAAP